MLPGVEPDSKRFLCEPVRAPERSGGISVRTPKQFEGGSVCISKRSASGTLPRRLEPPSSQFLKRNASKAKQTPGQGRFAFEPSNLRRFESSKVRMLHCSKENRYEGGAQARPSL